MRTLKLSIIQSIRTNNFKDVRLLKKISQLWEEVGEQLPENVIVYAVYHEYESDYKGDYSLSIATEDEANGTIEISSDEKYIVYKVDPTLGEQGVFTTWRNIWRQEEESEMERTYSIDFEKYYPNGEIEIHIAIKYEC